VCCGSLAHAATARRTPAAWSRRPRAALPRSAVRDRFRRARSHRRRPVPWRTANATGSSLPQPSPVATTVRMVTRYNSPKMVLAKAIHVQPITYSICVFGTEDGRRKTNGCRPSSSVFRPSRQAWYNRQRAYL
jgi:hypothetical protein